MSFNDPYAVYVLSSYGATALILGWLLFATLGANTRARRALEEEE
ncbi:MAG: heme exporter protein CcmD [Pseudomonadota bacterium]